MKKEFKTKLENHDWYYDYSDDYRVWENGRLEFSNLSAMHDKLKSPFSMVELRQWAYDMVLEKFEEDKPGEFYRKGASQKCITPSKRQNLLTLARFQEIEDWLNG